MYADEIRRAVEASSRISLPAVTALLWRAYGEGKVTEAEAEALSTLIEAKREKGTHETRTPKLNLARNGEAHTDQQTPQDPQRSPRTGVGSRPRSDASLERRRRWAASGRLPPALAARFTLAEQAALSLVASETARRGDCRLSVGHLAAVAGVAERTVQNAIREARKLGLLTVEERRVTGFRNDTNVVRIVSPEWTAWLRLSRKGAPPRHPLSVGGGCKTSHPTPTQVLKHGKTRPQRPSQRRVARAGMSS